MRALSVCAPCDGYGVLMKECGKRCEACHGLGHVIVAITEDDFFKNLPPGMTRDQAEQLLGRLRRQSAQTWWSPYENNNGQEGTYR